MKGTKQISAGRRLNTHLGPVNHEERLRSSGGIHTLLVVANTEKSARMRSREPCVNPKQLKKGWRRTEGKDGSAAQLWACFPLPQFDPCDLQLAGAGERLGHGLTL